MGDDTKRLMPGDRWRPTAEVLNGYQDAADYVGQLKSGGGALVGPGSGFQPAVVTVRNDSGADCGRFAVLGIDRPIFLPAQSIEAFTSRVAFVGIEPDPDEHKSRFVVLLRPLASGKMGPAAVAGAVQARVYVQSQPSRFCDVIDAANVGGEDCYLGTADSGAQILWIEDGAAIGQIAWAVIRLGYAGGGGTVASNWFQCLSSVDDGNAPWCFANPLTFDARSLTRLDLTAWTWQTDHWEYNYAVPPFNGVTGLLQAGVTVVLLDSCQPRHWGAFTGDCFTAEDTGVTITISNPQTDNGSLSGNIPFKVWAMQSRQTCQDGYDAVLSEVLMPKSAARATIGIDGIPMERWVYDTLMEPGQGFVPPDYRIGVRYDADKRMWIVTGAACLPTNT